MPARKFLELAIDPAAPDHVLDPQAAALVERHVAHALGLGSTQVVAAGKPLSAAA